MASSYTASLQPLTFPGGGGRRAWYHSNTRVLARWAHGGRLGHRGPAALVSRAVGDSTRIPIEGASHGGRGVKPLRSPGSIRCRARPFVVPWRLNASVDRPRCPSAPQRRIPECGMETESPPVPRWRDGGRRYWGGIAALISTAIQPRLERAVPVIELGTWEGGRWEAETEANWWAGAD